MILYKRMPIFMRKIELHAECIHLYSRICILIEIHFQNDIMLCAIYIEMWKILYFEIF